MSYYIKIKMSNMMTVIYTYSMMLSCYLSYTKYTKFTTWAKLKQDDFIGSFYKSISNVEFNTQSDCLLVGSNFPKIMLSIC